MKKFDEFIKEDGGGVASVGAASTAGMGSVVSAQPSSNAGQTMSPGFEAGGGSEGSGDIGSGWAASKKNNSKKKKKKKKKKKNEEMDVFMKPTIGMDMVTSFEAFNEGIFDMFSNDAKRVLKSIKEENPTIEKMGKSGYTFTIDEGGTRVDIIRRDTSNMISGTQIDYVMTMTKDFDLGQMEEVSARESSKKELFDYVSNKFHSQDSQIEHGKVDPAEIYRDLTKNENIFHKMFNMKKEIASFQNQVDMEDGNDITIVVKEDKDKFYIYRNYNDNHGESTLLKTFPKDEENDLVYQGGGLKSVKDAVLKIAKNLSEKSIPKDSARAIARHGKMNF